MRSPERPAQAGSTGAGAVSLTLANQCPQPSADAVAQSAGRPTRRRAGPKPPRRGTAACCSAGGSQPRRVAARTRGWSHAGPAARGGSLRGRAAGRRARRTRADTRGRRPPDASLFPHFQRLPVACGEVEGGGEQAPMRSYHPRWCVSCLTPTWSISPMALPSAEAELLAGRGGPWASSRSDATSGVVEDTRGSRGRHKMHRARQVGGAAGPHPTHPSTAHAHALPLSHDHQTSASHWTATRPRSTSLPQTVFSTRPPKTTSPRPWRCAWRAPLRYLRPRRSSPPPSLPPAPPLPRPPGRRPRRPRCGRRAGWPARCLR